MSRFAAPGLAGLKAYIAEGDFGPGDRLPPERVLTETLGMKRATLRRALDVLEQQGVIWRHVGKGTFLSEAADDALRNGKAEPAANNTVPFPGNINDIARQLSPVKMVRARLCLEPAIAREAAINASAAAVGRIEEAVRGCEEAEDWAGYEAWDDELHQAIAEATDNPLLVSLFLQVNNQRRGVANRNVVRATERPPRTHTSFVEHRTIASAIAAHDHTWAHDAMRRHIGSVSARLFGEI